MTCRITRSVVQLSWMVLLFSIAPACVIDPREPVLPLHAADQWTLVVLPDTQVYARSYTEIFYAQGRWIAQNVESLNICGVLHVGDVVDNNSEAQWTVARQALEPIIGKVPLVIAPGNHDYGDGGSANDRGTLLHRYFSVEEAMSQPSFGGLFDPERLDNGFFWVDTPEGPWLVIALEFGPRDVVVAWASDLLTHYPGTPSIILTHAYLYSDDTRYDWKEKSTGQQWNPNTYGVAAGEAVNDGEALYQKLVKPNPQISLVLSGHVLHDGLGRRESQQVAGGTVHEIQANFQMNTFGGEGYLRLMRFGRDLPYIEVQTYSPWRNAFKTDPDNMFTLARQLDSGLASSPSDPQSL